MRYIKSLFLHIAKFFGIRITRNAGGIVIEKYYEHVDCATTIQVLLKYGDPKVVYDIGANRGSWSATLHQLSSQLEEVVFFEPQTKYQVPLQSLKLDNVKRRIMPIGLSNQKSRLNIKGGNESASFLDVNEDFGLAELTNEEEYVEVGVLDDVVREFNLPVPDLLKIDVQGFELKVLQGARELLAKTRFVILELSLESTYIGQEPLSAIMSFMEANNFVLVDFGFAWREDYNFRKKLLQIDGIFENRSK